ncbi:hypothetical protein [Bradyrhizobium sp. URHD0069]|uniref:hypothetical protein n=1 Tax=Bradyrhizobium sp. URHD0069 TaxID=1380355 RepID=UPI0012DBDD4E|nr:hypothetical protein [Bradyrhizobium sp. URHD0069]
MKQVVTAKNCLQVLDSLRDEVNAAFRGYREQVYGFMAKAWLIVLLLRRDKELQRKFIRRAKLKVAAKGTAALKVVTEVMAYVMGVKTESGRKLAWKRGRVIEFLHDQGIKIAKIAAEIQSRGGIEAVLKQAAAQKPRRPKEVPRSEEPTLDRTRHGHNDGTPQHGDFGVTAESSRAIRRNDRKVTMAVLIRLSDRDALAEFPAGSRVKIYGTLVGLQPATIEISRVKKLNGRTGNLRNDEDDW